MLPYVQIGLDSPSNLLIAKKDRRPMVRRSPLREGPRDARDAEE
jgi:hypothetical protein